MSAVSGRDLSSSPDLGPRQIANIVAKSLRTLHSLDTRRCPYDQRIDRMMARALTRLEAGLVRGNELSACFQGRTPSDLFEELTLRRPQAEDLAVTHGDPCLPNLLHDRRKFTGFVDCGRIGVSDRHRDLALAARSIGSNLGEGYVKLFFELYGLAANADQLAFYCLLDEFF